MKSRPSSAIPLPTRLPKSSIVYSIRPCMASAGAATGSTWPVMPTPRATSGCKEERRFHYAYTYRDYVIRAFNEDLPYDQFIIAATGGGSVGGESAALGDDRRRWRHWAF